MIDPLETVIQHLKADVPLAALVGNQIASKHRFGQDWPVGSAALAVRADGGLPDAYSALQPLHLEARCYGEDQYEAACVWTRLVEVCRQTQRVTVATSQGHALLHYLQQDSGLSLLWDGEVRMDVALVFLRALVSEVSVG